MKTGDFMTVDALNILERLEKVGFPQAQAREISHIIKDMAENELATKRDLKILEKDLTITMGKMLTAAVVFLSLFMGFLEKF
jgi:precorrin-2 methylase